MKNNVWQLFLFLATGSFAVATVVTYLDLKQKGIGGSNESIDIVGGPPESIGLVEDPDESIDISRNAEMGAIEQALAQLDEGSFFHNVPAEMEVGVPITIESGIAIDNVKEVLERNNISADDFLMETIVLYDPLRTELELFLPSDAFSKEIISAGRKLILAKNEPVWSWRVIPKKSGQHLIIIKVNVKLTSPLTGEEYPKEFTTFHQHRLVKVNYTHSFRSFVADSWKDLLTRIIGPGTLVGFGAWWIKNRQEKKLKKKRRPPGFIR